MTPSEHEIASADTASQLLARRAQLQDWLGRLESVDDDIPAQVASRVRADYEERLAAVVAELSVHSETLATDRQILDERLIEATERHDAAVDALEEARLRHRIGELSDEDWETRRPGLEAELREAADGRAAVESEIAALAELLAQIAPPEVPPATDDSADTVEFPNQVGVAAQTSTAELASTGEVGDADSRAAFDEWVPELPVLDGSPSPEVPAAPQEAAAASESDSYLDVSAYGVSDETELGDDLLEITNFAAAAEALADEVDPQPADDDYAFLQELDRTIAATAPAAESEEDPEQVEATRPQPGLKCPDCGYSNDPAAWYCGVCGVDLG